jgi:hypothetical protein
MPRFICSCGGGFYELGMQEEEKRKSGESGTEVEPASIDIL